MYSKLSSADFCLNNMHKNWVNDHFASCGSGGGANIDMGGGSGYVHIPRPTTASVCSAATQYCTVTLYSTVQMYSYIGIARGVWGGFIRWRSGRKLGIVRRLLHKTMQILKPIHLLFST